MKKRKSPFAMIAILAIIFVAVIMVNARSHADTAGGTPDQPAAAKQDDSKGPPTAAPTAASLSKTLKGQVGGGKKLKPQKPAGARPALENPYPDAAVNAPTATKQKVDPNSGVQGGWYQKDSALNK